jgi:hypothetical protein
VTVIALSAKALIAVLLVAAGGAKLADLPGFAGAVELFMPRHMPSRFLHGAALWLAVGEIMIGAASLSSPGLGWLNPVVLGVGCGFLIVSAAGYAWHRDRSCHCFGALSTRTFNAAGIGRTAAIVAGAALGTVPVRSSLIQLSPASRLGLLAGTALVAWAAFTAAAAVAGRGQVGQEHGGRDSARRDSIDSDSASHDTAGRDPAGRDSARRDAAPRWA